MKHQDIKFKTRRTQVIDTIEKDNLEIEKELDKTNPEDLPEYIWPLHTSIQQEVQKITGTKEIGPQD